MTISSTKARPWEVWLAYVRFADHPDIGKVRPVVILDQDVFAIVVAKITSAQQSERFSYCELEDWMDEGLLKPSRVQLTPLFRVAPHELLKDEPLGVLSDRDCRRLAAALQSNM